MIIQVIIEGILMGGIYAVASLGLSLIFGVMRITNFAHGAIMTVGMFVSYLCFTSFGLSPYLSIPISMTVLFLLGYFIRRFLIKKIENAPGHDQLLLTLGVSIILENLLLAVFGPDSKGEVFEKYSKTVSLFGVKVSFPKLIAFFIVIAVSIALYLFLYKTASGRAIRATSMNKNGALLMGIVVKKTNALAFGIGCMLAGLAGTLLISSMNIEPTVGASFQLTCFVVAVLGGMGNLIGALASGFLIGVAQALTSYFFSGKLSSLIIYLIFVVVLMFKPSGLFERGTSRE